MDPFIRDYDAKFVQSKVLQSIDKLNEINEVKNGSFKIFHMNIRSIQKHFDDLMLVLSQLDFDFDAIVLTETFQICNTEIFNIRGYNIIYNEGSFNSHDGVIVYIKSTFHYKCSLIDIGELRAIELNISNFQEPITLTAIYRSPSSNSKIFIDSLTKYLSECHSNKNHIVTGDINFNLLDETDDDVDEYKNVLNLFDFTSYVNQVTRRESKTCLDHIFVKRKFECSTDISSYVALHDITDHDAVVLTINFTKQEKKMVKEQSKTKTFFNYDKLRGQLSRENWGRVYATQNIDSATNRFIEILQGHIQSCICHVSTQQKTKINKKPWITQGLLSSITIKNNLYQQFQKDRNNIDLEAKYKTYKVKLRHLLSKAKKNYFHRFIDRHKSTSKGLWACVNDICGKHKPETKIDKLKIENETITEPQKIADEFNNFYSDLGERLANKINEPKYFKENIPNLEKSMYLTPINYHEIIAAIKSLKGNKTPGMDGIRAETLKQISDLIAAPLTKIFNKCFEEGCFPSSLKRGLIKPIYKGGNKYDTGNYRPISLISTLSKILEKLVKVRIVDFLDKFNIISERQYGFREGKSAEDAIYFLTSKIYNSIDNKQPSVGIFLDLSKAFDTVCHKTLLRKLQSYGLRGRVYDLLKSYLTDRQQWVSIGDSISGARTVNYGVPQGTVLGPLLFIIYVNSVMNLELEATVLSFADDTVIYCESDDWNNLKIKAEGCLKVIKKWFEYNKLTLNLLKTRFLCFTSYANNLPLIENLKIDEDLVIPVAKSVKYLGIAIDEHLRWDLQANNVANKIRNLIGRFKYLKEFLNVTYLRTLYFSLIQSQMSYGILGWGGINDCHLKKINILQKWIMKIIYQKDITFPTDELYSISQFFDIRQLYCYKILVNIHQGKIPLYPVDHPYKTRNRDCAVKIPKCNKSAMQKSVTYLGPKLYNIIPVELRMTNNKNTFKRKLKLWMQQKNRHVFNSLVNNK